MDKEQKETTSETEPPTKIQDLHKTIDEVEGQMKKNIESMLNLEDKLDTLHDVSHNLRSAAEGFQKTSQKVKCSYCTKNVKITVTIAVVVLIIVLIIILLCTGVIPAGTSQHFNSTSIKP